MDQRPILTDAQLIVTLGRLMANFYLADGNTGNTSPVYSGSQQHHDQVSPSTTLVHSGIH